MATYPTTGSTPWNATLKSYIDQGPLISNTPPASPTAGQIWRSRALVDVHVSTALGDRNVIFAPLSGEGQVQEVSVFVNSTNYCATYTGGGGICLRTCPLSSDPMVPANWTKVTGTGSVAGEVIGQGAGGTAGLVNHGQVYKEGSTLHYFANIPATNKYGHWTAALNTPQTWTFSDNPFVAADLTTLGAANWGNSDVVLSGGTYYMLIEFFQNSSNVYQMVWATASAANGPWTLSGTTALTSGYLGSGTFRFNSFSGPKIKLDNGQWVLFYHTNNWWGLSVIARATMPSLGSDNFTPLDQPASNTQPVNPWIYPVSAYEVEQCADIEVFTDPSGQQYAFWTAADNRSTSVFRIMATPLLSLEKVYDGLNWHPNSPAPGRDLGVAAATRPVSVTKTTDFAGTSTTYATLISQVCRWNGTELDVELHAVVTASATGTYKFRALTNTPGTVTATMGGVALTGGVATAITLKGRLAHLTPGVAATVNVQYLVPAAATLNCRPATLPADEVCIMTVTDMAYRPI